MEQLLKDLKTLLITDIKKSVLDKELPNRFQGCLQKKAEYGMT